MKTSASLIFFMMIPCKQPAQRAPVHLHGIVQYSTRLPCTGVYGVPAQDF
jgi:hypothetical protein